MIETLFALLILPAAAAPPVEDLAEVRRDLNSISEGAWDTEREAYAFSRIWGWHVEGALAAQGRGERVAGRPSSDQRDRIFYEWRSRRNAEAVARRDYGWFKLDEGDQRRLFGSDMGRAEMDLKRTLARLDSIVRLERYRDWLLASEPEPEPVRQALRRARDLMAQGRRVEAVETLKGLGPEADFSPRAILARAIARMAEGDMTLPRDEFDRFYEALRARDPQGRHRELSWEMLCRAQQSRSGDWRFGHPSGDATEEQWDLFVRELGIRKTAPEHTALRDFLKSHPAAAAAAVKAARARPACGSVRVARDGSGDVRTIAAGLERLRPFDGEGQLLLAPGRYEEEVRVQKSRVLIRAWPRGSATIVPPPGRPGLLVHDSEGMVLDGVTIVARGANAVEVHASRGVTLKHCRLEASPGFGLFNDGSPEVEIWDCALQALP